MWGTVIEAAQPCCDAKFTRSQAGQPPRNAVRRPCRTPVLPCPAVSGPCDGITVIDLTRSLAGALATMLLADCGASVIMLEPPGGHPLRAAPGFLTWARGKNSVQLSGGERIIDEFLSPAYGSDVLLEDLSAADAAEVGINPGAIALANPQLIHCSIPSFGTSGWEAELPADDALVAARCGIMGSQPGFRAGPVFVRPSIASYGAALLVTQAIAAALYARERDGRGRRLTVPLLHGALAMQASQLLDIERGDVFPGPRRTHAGAQPLYRLYQCQDGRWLHLGVLTPRFWPGVALATGHPEWVSDPRYKTMPNLPTAAEREAFMEMFAAVIDQKPAAEWEKLFDEHDVPCAPAQTVDEFRRDPQVAATGLLTDLFDPVFGRTRQISIALEFARTPGCIGGAAPALSPVRDQLAKPAIGARASAASEGHAGTSAGADDGKPPLDGIRILDLSSFIAGPLGPAFLADLGADVIKVEAPEGDGLRANRGFIAWNRGKRGLGLDLKRPEGREVLYRLVKNADVVVENMRPGTAERLSVDYETLRGYNPRLIYCSVTAFGATGPYRHKPGFDPLLQARSGIERTQGGFQNPPVFLLTPITDNTCAMLNAVGIALALFERERSGEGQRVETSLLRSAAFLQADGLLDHEGRAPRAANDVGQYGPNAMCRLYHCADGWLFLAARDPAQQHRLASLLDMDHEPEVRTGPATAHEVEVASELATMFVGDSVESWLRKLRQAGVPAVRAVEDYARTFADDPLLAEAGVIVSYAHPAYGRIRHPAVLARSGPVPASATRPAPLLGQHSRQILAEAGYGASAIDDLLVARTVVQTDPNSTSHA